MDDCVRGVKELMYSFELLIELFSSRSNSSSNSEKKQWLEDVMTVAVHLHILF